MEERINEYLDSIDVHIVDFHPDEIYNEKLKKLATLKNPGYFAN